MPHFSEFVLAKWQNNALQLLLLIPDMIDTEMPDKPVCPEGWQLHAIAQFRHIAKRNEYLVECSQFLVAIRHLSLRPDLQTTILNTIGEHVDVVLHDEEGSPIENFMLGPALRFYVEFSASINDHLHDWWPHICSRATKHASRISYLEAILDISRKPGLDFFSRSSEILIGALISNLHSDSHQLRKLSLYILRQAIFSARAAPHNAFDIAIEIEETTLNLQAARYVSMQIRKLATLFKPENAEEISSRAIPHFCFGLMTYKLSQVRDDAVAALNTISGTQQGEAAVSELAFDWLESVEPVPELDDVAATGKSGTPRPNLTEFDCSNKIEIDNLIARSVAQIEDAQDQLEEKYFAVTQDDSRAVVTPQSLALSLLQEIPHVAEKRSRSLVPYLLHWATGSVKDGEQEDSATSSVGTLTSEQPTNTWKQKDRKALVDLFARFTNPRALYKANEVFEALKRLLCNGDLEIQKSALKAIFTWKLKEIVPYEETLLNLLDGARFGDEIMTFFNRHKQDNQTRENDDAVAMPILLRLLYGRMIARTGGSSGTGIQAAKRRVVLEAIYDFRDDYMAEFVALSLGGLCNLGLLDSRKSCNAHSQPRPISARKQVGTINMIKSMLEVLGKRLTPFAKDLIEALLCCLLLSVRHLSTDSQGPTSLFKVIRHTSVQCLVLVAQCFPPEDLRPYLPLFYKEVLSPRMENLAIETAQGVSGFLQLFAIWASSPRSVQFLVKYDSRTLKSITDSLNVSSCKIEVKLFVVEKILLPVIGCCEVSYAQEYREPRHNPTSLYRLILQPNVEHILRSLGLLLRGSPSKEALASCIRLIAALSPLVGDSPQIIALLDISVFLLDQPTHRISPKSKADLLKVLEHFLPLAGDSMDMAAREKIFRSISALFGFFRDRDSRLALVRSFEALAKVDKCLERVASLCRSLNAYDRSKIDEPDFDERLAAFSAINESEYADLSARQWRPLLYNMLFHVRNEDELAIRSNASLCLRRFVAASSSCNAGTESEFLEITQTVLLRNLRKGASEDSELVRAEFVAVMEVVVRHNPHWQEVSDMNPLLVGNDHEASFFANVLHIQQHRRLRALRRLAAEGRKGSLHSVNVAHFFMPLVEHFIFGKADDESAHNLSAEAVVTIGELAALLEWPQFKAMFQRFCGLLQSNIKLEKSIAKLLGVTIDALGTATSERGKRLLASEVIRSTLANTLPTQEKLADDITRNFLPPLSKCLHGKDESTVSLRTPIAVTIAKLLKLLPEPRFIERLPPLLTDVCNILRSRAQESRDLTRKTLTEISVLLGPRYFQFLLKELRSALARGYQLHVLSFTMHSILVATSSIYKPGDLDYCLPQIVAVIMDDVFGAVGQEKDAEDYISKMKEVKASKSFDSMELVARTATVENLVQLIRPLQSLLEEKLDVGMVKKIDEMLRRIGSGLIYNKASEDRRILIFCHEIIREVYTAGDASLHRTAKDDARTKRLLINYHGTKSRNRGSSASCKYKLARFALDTLRTVLQRHDHLRTPTNILGFIPVIGDAVIQSNDEIQTAALRLLASIIRVPLQSIGDNAPIYVKECVKIVRNSSSTSVELVQAALKLVSVILRERHANEIQESDLVYLLDRLTPDLDEPDRQGLVFNLLKAIMIRKIVIPEIYKTMDMVGTVMVVNHTKSARDMARGAFIQFLMEYPQSKDRFSKQIGFLVRNLDFTHEDGRQSVMEAIHLLFTKSGGDLSQRIFGDFFVPLVLVIVNDESSRCREMAGALLKTLFERSDSEHVNALLMLLRAWITQHDGPLLIRAAYQAYGIYFEQCGHGGEKEMRILVPQIAQDLKSKLKGTREDNWEVLYCVLQTFAKICQILPVLAFSASTAPLWSSTRQCLSYPHGWVKISAAKLMGLYFADFAKANAGKDPLQLPLKGSNGLWLTEAEAIEVTRASLALLKVPSVGEDLVGQCVRNLAFLGKLVAQTDVLWPQRTPIQAADGSNDSLEDSNEEVSRETHDERSAFSHIIFQLCLIVRRPPATTRASSLVPISSTLQLLAVLTRHVPTPTLRPFLAAVLLPLQILNDPTVPAPFSTDAAFNERYRSMVSNAGELMSNLQEKIGTGEYIRVLQGVREGIKGRRQDRRTKRAIEKVSAPEKAGNDKMRKGERKREKRKERSGEERGRRRGW